jgi:type IV pilus assembly protein PilN
MRNIENSPWLTAPELIEIRAVALDKQKVNEFTLALQLKRAQPGVETLGGKSPTPPAKAPPGKTASAPDKVPPA